jgi:hypothetical protein
LGDISWSIASSASLVFAPCRLLNAVRTRRSSWPPRSSATTVFSKVAGFGLLAIAATSFSSCSMPALKAGAKCSLRILSKAGYCSGKVLVLKKGFAASGAAGAALAMLPKASAMLAARTIIAGLVISWSVKRQSDAASSGGV